LRPGRRRVVLAEAFLEPRGLLLGLLLVPLQRTLHLRVLRRSDHAVEHPQHVLLHRVRVVDVLDQLLLERCHVPVPSVACVCCAGCSLLAAPRNAKGRFSPTTTIRSTRSTALSEESSRRPITRITNSPLRGPAC